MTTTTERDMVETIGKLAFEAIAKMVAALEVDWERFEELKEVAEDPETKYLEWKNRDEYEELKEAAGDCKSEEDALRRISGDPLSVEVGGWWTPDSEPRATEYRILLRTGEPAVRIVGDLGQWNEPGSARLEVQDRFKLWIEYSCDEQVLVAYASELYLGE